MKDKKFSVAFLVVCIAAVLYTMAEIIMQSIGSSICATEGCALVSSRTRFGDISILLIGLLLFLSMAVLHRLETKASNIRYSDLIDALIIAALAAEGFFTGYQAFHIKTPCAFCLSIFGIILMLGMIRLASGRSTVAAGFGAFISVFAFLYLVLPAGNTLNLPTESRLVLFYSDECRHCIELKMEIENRGLAVLQVPVRGHADFLKAMGIEHVPTLFVNEPYQKMFFTGKETIERFLFGKEKGGASKGGSRTNSEVDTGNGLPGVFTDRIDIFQPSGDPDACKETEECR